ncbi:ATP-binding region, ATPase-like:Histidine kinase A-like [Olavius algarvensis spirochete endosymbiont]|nr:ATP-binding region, ATPase-like:Histidine kinase A-like [Olavius algarvensis spirochete endosymbiont]
MSYLIKSLRRIDTFSALSEPDLIALASICIPAQYPARSVIAREGFDAQNLFALISGTVGIWVDYDTEKADLLAIREAPCLVGEMSVADDLPRSATIVAASPVDGYSIEANYFRKLLAKRGSIAFSLMKGISRIVRSSNDTFISELRKRNKELIETNKKLRKAHQQLVRQERLSNLGKFSSMIIHDLRNPLSAIRGYADLLALKLEGKSYTLHKYASQIRQETSRLTNLTGELLDYSRGEIRLMYSPVTVAELFAQLKKNIETKLAAKELNLTWDNQFTSIVLLDFNRITRVLLNLLDNAQKACGKKGEIEVSAKGSEKELILCVKDNGVGMDEKTMQHIFEPFYSTSDRGGTGLGMHIVKTVVEAHKGIIDVRSEVEVGTQISIKLPLQLQSGSI